MNTQTFFPNSKEEPSSSQGTHFSNLIAQRPTNFEAQRNLKVVLDIQWNWDQKWETLVFETKTYLVLGIQVAYSVIVALSRQVIPYQKLKRQPAPHINTINGWK